MSKFYKYFEYAYLVFALVFMVTAIFEFNTDRSRAYMMLFFSAVAVFMFFFKRRFRRRMENRNKPNGK